MLDEAIRFCNRRNEELGFNDSSDYYSVAEKLRKYPCTTFMDWGCATGSLPYIASIIGFTAFGVEKETNLYIHAARLARSRTNLFVVNNDYMKIDVCANLNFVYCWPYQMEDIRKHFLKISNKDAAMLFYFGKNRFMELKVLDPAYSRDQDTQLR